MSRTTKVKEVVPGWACVHENGEDIYQPMDFDKNKRWWYLECDGYTMRSNLSVDYVMRVWAALPIKPKVFTVGSVG